MVKVNAMCLWNWNEEPDGGFLTDHKIECFDDHFLCRKEIMIKMKYIMNWFTMLFYIYIDKQAE